MLTGPPVVVVVVVFLTLTRIIKSVVTGQAPVTHSGAEEYPREKHKPKVVHAYITANSIHASGRPLYPAVSGGGGCYNVSSAKLLVNLLQVVKRTNTPRIP